MRAYFALPVMALAGCSVDHDPANDQMRVEYNQQRMEDAADRAARTAKTVGTAAGNVAVTAGRAIGNEVGDVDVDVDVRRRRPGETGNSAEAR